MESAMFEFFGNEDQLAKLDQLVVLAGIYVDEAGEQLKSVIREAMVRLTSDPNCGWKFAEGRHPRDNGSELVGIARLLKERQIWLHVGWDTSKRFLGPETTWIGVALEDDDQELASLLVKTLEPVIDLRRWYEPPYWPILCKIAHWPDIGFDRHSVSASEIRRISAILRDGRITDWIERKMKAAVSILNELG